jgi:hypothetical protein
MVVHSTQADIGLRMLQSLQGRRWGVMVRENENSIAAVFIDALLSLQSCLQYVYSILPVLLKVSIVRYVFLRLRFQLGTFVGKLHLLQIWLPTPYAGTFHST